MVIQLYTVCGPRAANVHPRQRLAVPPGCQIARCCGVKHLPPIAAGSR